MPDAAARFNAAIFKLIGLLCESATLVLFIDDLQWADASSLNLLRCLSENAPRAHERLLVVVGWRDHLDPSHPAAVWVNNLTLRTGRHMPVTALELKPLSLDAVADLLSDVLQLPKSEALLTRLAHIFVEKSSGVPFFILQLLACVQKSGALSIDADGSYQIDVQIIAEQQFGDGVRGFLLPRIRALPQEAQRLLGVAACIGSEFQ